MINILEMLERSAEEYGGKTAFSDPDKEITFAELKVMSEKTATALADIKGRDGLTPESAIAFYMEKSVDSLIVMFAGMYLSDFYSFIDIRQTANRAESIISVLEPEFIITDDANRDALYSLNLPDNVKNRIVLISDLLKKAEKTEADNAFLSGIRKGFYDKMPLYVNFTSGSTGVPKGVVVGHASVIEFIEEFTSVFGITNEDVLANQAPFDFDVSVKDIYSGLYTGAAVALIPREYFSNPSVLMDYLTDKETTVLIWAVSAMCFVSIMNGLEYKTPTTIKR